MQTSWQLYDKNFVFRAPTGKTGPFFGQSQGKSCRPDFKCPEQFYSPEHYFEYSLIETIKIMKMLDVYINLSK